MKCKCGTKIDEDTFVKYINNKPQCIKCSIVEKPIALSQWKSFLDGQGIEHRTIQTKDGKYKDMIRLRFKVCGHTLWIDFNPDGSLYKEVRE